MRGLGSIAAVLVATVVGSAVALGEGFFPAAGDDSVAALQQANDAYLRKDLLHMVTALRLALSDPAADDASRRAALSLLNRAYDSNSGQVPADWQLPTGMKTLIFKQFRKEHPGNVVYDVQLNAHVLAADSVRQMQLVRYPSEVVLDLKAGVGKGSAEADGDGTFHFDLDSGEQPTPLVEGLYLLNIEMSDGQKTNGWVVVSDLVASASPTIAAPALGETLTSQNPELRWTDFRSPEFKSWESRHLALHLGHVTGSTQAWEDVWSLYKSDPTATSATVGAEPHGSSQMTVADGKYWGIVGYQEQRVFGPVRLRRCASTSQYFYVKTK